MITVTLFKRNGSIVKMSTQGHSGLNESGQDILCAAVSTLVQTAYLAVKDLAESTQYKRDERKALFEFDIPEVADRHDIDVVLRATVIGLQDLSSGYPQNLKLEETSICL